MNLQVARVCPRKAALNQNLSSAKGKHFAIAQIIQDFLLHCELNDDAKKVREKLESSFKSVDEKLFSHRFEADANLRSLEECLIRWLDWEKQQGGTILKRGIVGDVTISGRQDPIQVHAHLLIDRGDRVEIIRVMRGRPKLSRQGRKTDTQILENTDLLCMQLLGESLCPGKPVYASFYHLKAKSDKSGRFSLRFEAKRGENIVSVRFTPSDRAYLENALSRTEICLDKRQNPEDCGDCTYSPICNQDFVPRQKVPSETRTSEYSRVKVTKAQEELILARKGYYRVNAVAGSGKTTVIALRTLSLLEESSDPEKVLMITFTEKAKTEMLNKVKGYEKAFYEGWDFNVEDLNIETFNSWGHKIVAMHHQLLGFSAEPMVVDDLTKRDIIVQLLEWHQRLPLNYEYPFMDLPMAKGAVMEMSNILDRLKSFNVKTIKDVREAIPATEDRNNVWFDKETKLLNIYNCYNVELRKRNLIDYEDQLRLLNELRPYGVFESMPYEHIIIDEFQDSNPNQIGIIEELVKVNRNVQSLVVVGDIMQAIYSFRNTSPENLLQFADKFENVIDIDMNENFRSDSGITNWANRIINKESKLPRPMVSKKLKKTDPVLLTYLKQEEAEDLALKEIRGWIGNGTPLSDIAILARTKNELLAIQKLLSESGIPSILAVPEILRDNAFVQSIFALSRYLENQEDVKSLAVYAKSIGVDPLDIKAVLLLGEELKDTLLSLPSEEEKLNAFLVRLEDLSGLDYAAEAFVTSLIRQKHKYLGQMLSYINRYDAYGVKEAFRAGNSGGNAVTLITVHSSKGLEYPNVLVLLEKFKDTSEEKRLFYVAVTRAQNNLSVLAKVTQTSLTELVQ